VRTALTLFALLMTIVPCAADPLVSHPRIRGISPRETRLIQEVLARSATARALAAEIEETDLIVYVQYSAEQPVGRAVTRLAAATNEQRYLRVIMGPTTHATDRPRSRRARRTRDATPVCRDRRGPPRALRIRDDSRPRDRRPGIARAGAVAAPGRGLTLARGSRLSSRDADSRGHSRIPLSFTGRGFARILADSLVFHGSRIRADTRGSLFSSRVADWRGCSRISFLFTGRGFARMVANTSGPTALVDCYVSWVVSGSSGREAHIEVLSAPSRKRSV
jgi:hypothetical protein